MSGRFYWDDFSDDYFWPSHHHHPHHLMHHRLDPLGRRRDSEFYNSSWDGYHRHWLRPRYEEPYRLSAAFNSGRDAYQVCLDVHQFAPSELSVKTVDDSVVVEGRHEEKEDKHGYISRHFKRRYVIPTGYDLEHVYSTLSSDGVLTVRAPRIMPEKEEEGVERIIPIQKAESNQQMAVNGKKERKAMNGHLEEESEGN